MNDDPITTDPAPNPYKPPAVAAGRVISKTFTWFYGACVLGLFGSVVGAAVVYFIYVDDPRTGTRNGPSLSTAVVGAAVCCGALWAIAGTVTGTSRKRVLIAHGMALVVVVLWIGIGGTYSDVLSAAAVAGWPLGGFSGALLAKYIWNGSANKSSSLNSARPT